jgi:DNA-binding transcriptional MerR regulator/effector-binding domain-containing protein
MDTLLSIGDFSRMTYLSVKALRHYHDVGVLEPARIDPATGYRFYRPSQVATAQIIRRFRDLGMPLDEVRAMLSAPDPDGRNQTITAHLARLERQLEETQEAVASLRVLLSGTTRTPTVDYRDEPLTPAFAVVERVAASDAIEWWMGAFTELHRAVRSGAGHRAGLDGVLFPDDFFTDEEGEVIAFVPASGTPPRSGRVMAFDVPAARVAVVTHNGPFSDLDRTYGELGLWVTERALAAPGPVRERYLPLGDEKDLLNHRTEVCWPVSGANAVPW